MADPTLVCGVLLVQVVVSATLGYGAWSACDQPIEALPGVLAFIQVGGLWYPMLKFNLLVGNYELQNACPMTSAPWTVSFEMQCYLLFPLIAALYTGLPVAVHDRQRQSGDVHRQADNRLGHSPWWAWLAWLQAPALALALFLTSVMVRLHVEDSHRFDFSFLMCEYAAGVLAYFLAGHGGLDWIQPSEHSLQRAFDRPILLTLQGLWYAATAAFLWVIGSHDRSPGFPLGRVLLAVSAALFIVCSCGFSCQLPTVDASIGTDGPTMPEPMQQARRAWLSLPLRWLLHAFSSPCLFPLASVSYTAYIIQGITLNLFFSRKLTAGRTQEDNGICKALGSPLAEPVVDLAIFSCTLLLNVLIGLFLSLAVERPLMNILYPLTGRAGVCSPCRRCPER